MKIEFENVPYSDIIHDHPNLWETINHEFPQLDLNQKKRLASLIFGLCKACFNEPYGCQCWNDE